MGLTILDDAIPAAAPDRSIRALRARLATEVPGEVEPVPEPRASRGLLVFAVCFAVGVWIAVFAVVIAPEKTKQLFQWSAAAMASQRVAKAPAVRYAQAAPAADLVPPTPRNCDEARSMGLAAARQGQPGYAPWLDADHDGISCEPRLRH